MWRLLKSVIKRMFQLMLLLAMMGLLFQFASLMRDRAKYPAEGRLFEVNGQTLHLFCRGEGSDNAPTVVLESGMGSESTNWHAVMEQVKGSARVCTYDRPGLGWSKPSRTFLTEAEWVTNLHDLLVVADVQPPYLLVGHSIGGIIVRDFAHKYPEKVAGLVLVESSTENQSEYWNEADHSHSFVPRAMTLLSPIGTAAGYFGLPRIYRHLMKWRRGVPLTYEQMASMARRNEAHSTHAIVGEMKVAITITDQKRGPEPLGDLPLRVIAKTYWVVEESTEAQIKFENDWRSMQQALAALSTNGTHVEAKQSAHNVPGDEPEIIVAAILDLLGD